ncbi:MAG: hypothetical protein H6742_09730 [Alphaproteobacteria bacterium]|nr:hypothetical protein [Alphaproteobacteria bacterium]
MTFPILPLAASLIACSRPDYGFSQLNLELEVTSPEYGVFLGEEGAVVEGRVSPAGAVLLIEGEQVQVGEGGNFSYTLPMEGLDYRMIDVEARMADQYARERIPVFSGTNPVELWPGAATARFTTAGLDQLGESVGAIVDATGWDTMIADAIPSVDTDYVDVYTTGVTHQPTIAYLDPGATGIAAQIVMQDISLGIEINALDGIFVVPISVGFEAITIDALLLPYLDDDKVLWLELSEAAIDIGAADFEIGALDGYLLELATDAVLSLIEPLSDVLLDFLLAEYGTIELFGPLAFETDLLGTSLAAEVDDLQTDVQGLGLGLGIGINEPAGSSVGRVAMPDEDAGATEAHAVAALHEGLFQLLLEDALIGLLADFDLSGTYGDILGNMLTTLPGGDDAPGGGWCIDLDPGDAYVVRMKESTLPVAQLHMPDFRFNAGTGSDCEPWLESSLEVTLDLGFENGTKLALDVEVPDGAIYYYGSQDEWTEDEVVAGLGTTLSTLIGLAGGFLDFDIADLLGGLAGDGSDPITAALGDELDVKVTDSRKLYNADGSWTEGMYVLSLNVFKE